MALLPLLSPLVALAAPTEADAQAMLLIEAQRLPAAALAPFAAHGDAATRARAALALGRLVDPAALPLLEALAADADEAVRHNAAFALGLCPGGAALALVRLSQEPSDEVRARLLAALGQAPPPPEALAARLGALVEGLAASPAEAAAAATALGRLASAGVEGLDATPVTDSLTTQATRRVDLDARRRAAFALARIRPESLSATATEALVLRAGREYDGPTRAWLLRALARPLRGDPRANAVLAEAVAHPEPGVRVAAARSAVDLLGPDARAPLLTLLDDRVRQVQVAALSAMGRLGDAAPVERLEALLAGEDDELAALALLALHEAGRLADPRDALKPSRPLRVQAAAVSTLSDTDQLARLATRSTEAMMRTAAASRLLELEPATAEALALLGAADPKVAATGAVLLGRAPSAGALEPLLRAGAKAEDAELLAEVLGALAATAPLVREPPRDALASLVAAAGQHADLTVRRRALALAEALGLPAPPRLVHAVALPQLDEVDDIVSARVLTEAGELRFTLRPDLAPLAVASFAHLAELDHFDGLAVHRLVPDFVVQAGCPRGDGWGGPGYTLPDELSWLPYEAGTLGMALSGPDTAGSQWFVTLSPQPHLDGGYTVFGQLSAGEATLARVRLDTVIEDVIIERIPR